MSGSPVNQVIAITGGAGTLADALAPVLHDLGWSVRLLDITEPKAPVGEFLPTDIRRPLEVRRALDGVESVIHAAAWHGIHLAKHPARDFWELNVDGTYNVIEAAADAGVRRIVLSSTMGVYGDTAAPDPAGSAVRVSESMPLKPGDVYGQSKVLSEQLVAFAERTHGIRTVALRYGMFVPEPFAHYGIRMLYGGVDARDVAAANVAALARLERPGRFTAYNIFSALPFDDEDLDLLRADPLAAVDRHWPGGRQALAAADVTPWGPINAVYDISRARDDLGWRPKFGFAEFLDGLRRGVSSADDLRPASHR